jgi:hypothetical protein
MQPNQFCDTINTWDKSGPTVWSACVIFVKLAKVNDRQLGENSPNLVTLPELNASVAEG